MPFLFTCPHCGAKTSVAEQYAGQSGPCAGCGRTVTIPPPPGHARPRPLGDDAAMRFLLPVGRSLWAIAAGYMGLLSVLLLPAPVAVVLAIVAIRDIQQNPEKHGMGRAIFGLVMGILFTIPLIGLVIAMWLG
jgi:hypothetical protein